MFPTRQIPGPQAAPDCLGTSSSYQAEYSFGINSWAGLCGEVRPSGLSGWPCGDVRRSPRRASAVSAKAACCAELPADGRELLWALNVRLPAWGPDPPSPRAPWSAGLPGTMVGCLLPLGHSSRAAASTFTLLLRPDACLVSHYLCGQRGLLAQWQHFSQWCLRRPHRLGAPCGCHCLSSGPVLGSEPSLELVVLAALLFLPLVPRGGRVHRG